MMLYSDLIVRDGKTFVEELDIKDLKIYKDKPSSCPCCKSKKVIGLEVLGTKEGTLMWICDDCDSIFLKYNLEKTEEYKREKIEREKLVIKFECKELGEKT